MSSVHCEYCMCPIDSWRHSMKTYDGDECKLFSDFSDIIWDLEERDKYKLDDVVQRCVHFKQQYPDIKDYTETIQELINIGLDTGIMSKKYKGFATA